MWTEVECFKAEESPYQPGKYTIRVNHDNFHIVGASGSCNLICARLMNLSYAQYLRFCRDICGAELIGKNTKYPVAYFSEGARLSQLVRLLNRRANLVLWEREHPQWREHQEWLAEREANRLALKERKDENK